jgi:competence protein ComFC
LRNALHRLKYERDIALGETLARPLITLLQDLNWEVDFVTAVPAGIARRAERGYNQASLLALPLALGSGLPYHSRVLSKKSGTPSQVGLSLAERRANVAGAFQARPDKIQGIQGKRVLVVDDVTTSGATMEACAAALSKAGASRVYGLTLARAL